MPERSHFVDAESKTPTVSSRSVCATPLAVKQVVATEVVAASVTVAVRSQAACHILDHSSATMTPFSFNVTRFFSQISVTIPNPAKVTI